MRQNIQLEMRLIEWGREYGGGRYEDTGWHGVSPLYSLMRYHGRPPQGLSPKTTKDWTPADEVQRAVDTMAREQAGHTRGQVIRCEYMTPGLALDSRLQRLRSIGCPMSRSTYYRHLKEARSVVARMLGLMEDLAFEAA